MVRAVQRRSGKSGIRPSRYRRARCAPLPRYWSGALPRYGTLAISRRSRSCPASFP